MKYLNEHQGMPLAFINKKDTSHIDQIKELFNQYSPCSEMWLDRQEKSFSWKEKSSIVEQTILQILQNDVRPTIDSCIDNEINEDELLNHKRYRDMLINLLR